MVLFLNNIQTSTDYIGHIFSLAEFWTLFEAIDIENTKYWTYSSVLNVTRVANPKCIKLQQ